MSDVREAKSAPPSTPQASLFDDQAFAREQQALSHTWTLLGLRSDLTQDNDWVRASLGDRSVFVQKFGNDLVGFENVCPHRGFPLRSADRGNGQIICGFHHWHFDRLGRVVGIPICRDIFGTTPREVAASLAPIEIAQCGCLLFGRIASGRRGETLEQFLGDSWPILAAISDAPSRVHRFQRTVEANWRLMMSITLDDYHNVAVHHQPSHFKKSNLNYWRFGLHSALMADAAQTLQSVAEQCLANSYRPSDYMIINLFPNVAVSLFNAHPYWYSLVQQFVPLSPKRSAWRCWYFPTNFPAAGEKALGRALRPLIEPIRARIVRHHIERIGKEDHTACEQLQTVAHQFATPPILGSQETRVGWFLESYARIVGAGA